jgi:NTE family protein
MVLACLIIKGLIDRKNDEYTISNKTFDFSAGTINLLLERGYNDAQEEINQYVRNQLVT